MYKIIPLLLVLIIPACSVSNSKDNNSKPNILYIMADDHTANAISAYGLRYAEVLKTPNIDRLAEEGVSKRVFSAGDILDGLALGMCFAGSRQCFCSNNSSFYRRASWPRSNTGWSS